MPTPEWLGLHHSSVLPEPSHGVHIFDIKGLWRPTPTIRFAGALLPGGETRMDTQQLVDDLRLRQARTLADKSFPREEKGNSKGERGSERN